LFEDETADFECELTVGIVILVIGLQLALLRFIAGTAIRAGLASTLIGAAVSSAAALAFLRVGNGLVAVFNALIDANQLLDAAAAFVFVVIPFAGRIIDRDRAFSAETDIFRRTRQAAIAVAKDSGGNDFAVRGPIKFLCRCLLCLPLSRGDISLVAPLGS
jgi:membrane-associated protease RseP (regulator of RpoE activity)